tara:strand:+ start:8370 stop:8891 length:522 start_codon:yes stop_codon:yes gene_type:complete
MATPAPREAFDNDQEYLKDFWITTEFGVDDVDSYDYFLGFFGDGFCPQTKEEEEHYKALPDIGIKVYRGYELTSGSPYRMSWTPDKKEAEGFAFRSAMFEKCSRLHGGNKSTKEIMPMLASMTIGKGNIDAVLLQREVEYIICYADAIWYDEYEEFEIKIEERSDLLPTKEGT